MAKAAVLHPHKVVWWCRDYPQSKESPFTFTEIVHEIAHIVMEHPKRGFEVPEECGLFSLERAIAKRVDNACRASVYAWQYETSSSTSRPFRCLSVRKAKKVMQHGNKIARAIGIIDDNGDPTWRYADWSQVSDDMLYEQF